jgi:hypothetical protein
MNEPLNYSRPPLLTPAMRWVVFVVVLGCAAGFVLGVWPTMYRYEHRRRRQRRRDHPHSQINGFGVDRLEG